MISVFRGVTRFLDTVWVFKRKAVALVPGKHLNSFIFRHTSVAVEPISRLPRQEKLNKEIFPTPKN